MIRWRCLLAVLAGSCTLGTGSFAGKTCKTNVDCPDPYVCALVRPEGRTCELIPGVEIFDPSSQNPADWCRDVRPIMFSTCLSNCHKTTDMSYLGAPKTFRLDAYGPMGAILGAGAKATNINMRISADTMPPVNETGLPRCTPAEKGVVTRWLNSGAPFSLETDAGTCPDGGA